MKRPADASDCPRCKGRGFTNVADASGNNDSEACTRCSGKGWTMHAEPGEPGYDNDQFGPNLSPRITYADDLQPDARPFGNILKTDPELLALIERLKGHVMTPEEQLAQRRSWVLGQFMLSNPDVTKERATQLVDAVIADVQWRGLHKLTEEMGELAQVIGKLGAFPVGDHPDGGPPLRQRLEEECADVEAAILYFRERNGLDPMPARRVEKLQKFRKWGLSGPL